MSFVRAIQGRRSGWLSGLVLLGIFASALPLMTERADAATSSIISVKKYQRDRIDYPTASPPAMAEMWTRGYLDDACLTFPDVTCMSKRSPLKFRPEASAQALTLWLLAFKLGDNPVPLVRDGYTKVDWEVGPTKEVEAPDEDPPGDPQRDPCDPKPGPKLPTRWRIDIVVEKARIIEMKNYAKRSEVTNQLSCYISAAFNQHNVVLTRDTSLQGAVYPMVPINIFHNGPNPADPNATVWCVWHPLEPGTDGHAYFARLAETPPPYQEQCNPNPARGNNPPLDNQTVVDTMNKLAAALAAAVGGALLAAALIRKLMSPSPVKDKEPVGSGVQKSYQFDVLQLENEARLLNVDWGDGTASTVNVPMGTGVFTATLNKTFTNNTGGVRRLYQSVSVSENTLAPPGAPVAHAVVPENPRADFVTDVNPAPQAEPDPDGAPSNTITVGPSEYLSDGQQVTVSGAGFTPNSFGTLRLCTTGDAIICSNALTTMTTNASGAFTATMNVVRSFTETNVEVPPRTVDCAVIACRVVGQAGTYYASHHVSFGTLVAQPPFADFNGDGAVDLAVFRPSSGGWYVQFGPQAVWGDSGDVPVPGDYDGEGVADFAVFRPSSGVWYVNDGITAGWGTTGDMPVPADYDGSGTTDIAVFRPSNGTWYVKDGLTAGWGTTGDIPVPADYDADGVTDLAVFRPSNGVWYVNNGLTLGWGSSGDIPVPGDYNNDGKTDIAVFRPSNGVWYINGMPSVAWGSSGDIPVPGDYNLDGKTDIAVFRPSNGVWYVKDGVTAGWGTSGDRPLSLPHAIRQAFFP